MLDLSIIKTLDFPEDQYYREKFQKNQIVLHHTASGRGIDGDFMHWLNTPERIATFLIIDHDGRFYQLYSSAYWGHHLGVKTEVFQEHGIYPHGSNLKLNRNSIAIELDSWGWLEKKGDKFYSYVGTSVSPDNVQEYPNGFNGHQYYEKYTPEQIEALRQMLLYLGEKYDIPLAYNPKMWVPNKQALKGESGIWTHVSFRSDKTDCHPQPELIEMLKGLTTIDNTKLNL